MIARVGIRPDICLALRLIGIAEFNRQKEDVMQEIMFRELEALRAENARLREAMKSINERLLEAADTIEALRAENAKLLRRIHLFKNTRNEKVFEKLMKAHGEIEKLRDELKAQVVQWEAARAAMGETK